MNMATQQPKVGVLLTNLGTPDAPDRASLRRYLKEFLSDPRVVEMNRLLWWLILNMVILNIRPARSAASYRKVWSKEGSPLMQHSLAQQVKLQAVLGDDVVVGLAMRYGNPSIQAGLEALKEQGCTRILLFPLYPQYAASTTASTMDAVSDVLKTWRYIPEFRSILSYHDEPAYIEALAASIRQHWQEHGRGERLLMSFHGIPQRYADQGDPYPDFCTRTCACLAEALDLDDDAWFMSFQSRFGREAWLQPYTDATLKQWGADGVRRVDVVCPGFSSDCLETLEEIGEENRAYFLESGGESLHYIQALNADDAHIQALASIAQRHLQGWL